MPQVRMRKLESQGLHLGFCQTLHAPLEYREANRFETMPSSS